MKARDILGERKDNRGGIDVEHVEDVEQPNIIGIIASTHGRELGRVKFLRQGKTIVALDLAVKPQYQGQGIARVMYDYAKELGYKVLRSPEQTEAGAGFWDKYRGEKEVWEDIKELSRDSSPEFEDAMIDWIGMLNPVPASKIILASPESQPFKRPPRIKKLYRAIMPRDRQFNAIKANGAVVAFATQIKGALAFIDSLDTDDDWVIIEKPYNPGDFLLDFSKMARHYALDDPTALYEYEVWMKPTPVYATAKKSEIVLTSQQYRAQQGPREVWEQDLGEVKILSKVKGKGADLSNLPRSGGRIPNGQETRYLGQKVSDLNGLEIWRDYLGGQLSYHLYDPSTRQVLITAFGSRYQQNPHSFIIGGLYAAPGNPIKAAEFYRALIQDLDLTLISDRKQSPGGQRVWQQLEAFPDVEIYGFDTRTGRVLNFGPQDTEMYAIGSGDIKDRESKYIANNIRMVATKR